MGRVLLTVLLTALFLLVFSVVAGSVSAEVCLNPLDQSLLCNPSLTQAECCEGISQEQCNTLYAAGDFNDYCTSTLDSGALVEENTCGKTSSVYLKSNAQNIITINSTLTNLGFNYGSFNAADCEQGCCRCSGSFYGYEFSEYITRQGCDQLCDFNLNKTYFDTSIDISSCKAGEPKYTLTGVVKDKQGNPVEGVSIQAAGVTATSGTDGGFSVGLVPEGTVTVKAVKTGYKTTALQYSITQNEDIGDIIIEEEALGSATVSVKNLDGKPLSGITVKATNVNTKEELTGITDAAGNVLFSRLPLTKLYQVEVVPPSGVKVPQPQQNPIQKDTSFTFTLDMGLAPKGKISVSVVDTDNNPIPNAFVNLLPGAFPTKATDTSGNAVFDSVPFGDYKVVAAKLPAYDKAESSIVIDAGNPEASITLTLQKLPETPIVDVEFTVIPYSDSSCTTKDESVASDPIKVVVSEGGSVVAQKDTKDRKATFQLLRGHTYDVTARKFGFLDNTNKNPITLIIQPSGHVSPQNINLCRADAVPVTLKIVDELGEDVSLSSNGNLTVIETITGDSSISKFSILPTLFPNMKLYPGKYIFLINTPGYLDMESVKPTFDIVVGDTSKTKEFKLIKSSCRNGELPVIKSINRISGSPKMKIDYNFGCVSDIQSSTLLVCADDIGNDCKPSKEVVGTDNLYDVTLYPEYAYNYTITTPSKNLCFSLRADYGNLKGGTYTSESVCLPAGDAYCLQRSAEFCSDSKDRTPLSSDYNKADKKYGYRCDENNQLLYIEKEEFPQLRGIDPAGESCGSYTDSLRSSGDCKLKCRNKNDMQIEYYDATTSCSIQCNSILGLFGFGGKAVPAQGKGLQLCENLPGVCYEDYSKKAVDQFYDCEQVKSCYDYYSQSACESNDGAGGCLKGTSCVWEDSPKYKDLGIGVCKPANAEQQQCNACSDPNYNSEQLTSSSQYNALFSGCPYQRQSENIIGLSGQNLFDTSVEHCKLYGDKGKCYYQDIRTLKDLPKGWKGIDILNEGLRTANACRDASQTVCGMYLTEVDCGNAQIDVAYDTDGNRIGGTNKILTESEDWASLGKCRWDASKIDIKKSGRPCFKDADGNGKEDCGLTPGSECGLDFKNPVTVMSLRSPVQKIDFKFSVYDDKDAITPFDYSRFGTGRDDVNLYYAIVPKGQTKYPDIRISDLSSEPQLVDTDADRESGNYTLYYYSVDDSKNLEEVRSFDLVVDKEPPKIDVSYNIDSARNLFVTLESQEEVRCDATLKRLVGDPSGNPKTEVVIPEGKELDMLTPIIGPPYSITKKYAKGVPIENGIYVYEYGCVDLAGNEAKGNLRIVSDPDAFMFGHSPSGTINYNNPITLSLKTVDNAECRYKEETDSTKIDSTHLNFDDMTPFTVTGKTVHEATVGFPNIEATKGEKTFWVKCKSPVTKEVFGKTSAIRFAIDTMPPMTKAFIREADDLKLAIINNLDFDFGKWYDAANFKLGCYDEQLPPSPLNFGCKAIYYCISPTPDCAPEKHELQTPDQMLDINVDNTNYLCYYSEDKGNNSPIIKGGKMECKLIQVDKIPPFVNVTTTLNPLTNASAQSIIHLKGNIINYAFWKESYKGIIPLVFNDMTFTAEADASKTSRIKFHQGADEYEAVLTPKAGSIQFNLLKGGDLLANDVVQTDKKFVPVMISVKSLPTDTSIILSVNDKELSYDDTKNPLTSGTITLSEEMRNVAVLDKHLSSPIVKTEFYVNDVFSHKTSSTDIDDAVDLFIDTNIDITSPTTIYIKVTAYDEAGNSYEKSIPVVLDTVGPPAPTLDPDLEEYIAPPLSLIGYRLASDGRQYYTNDPHMPLSGYTDEAPVNVIVYDSGKPVDSIISKFFAEREPASLSKQIFKLQQDTSEGENQFFMTGDGTKFPMLSAGNYISFTHSREGYGHYAEYYKIADVKFEQPARTTITLTEPLEQFVKSGDSFKVYDAPRAADRFTIPLDLIEGNNYISLQAQDDLGNLGLSRTPNQPVNIYLDTSPPEFTLGSEYPANGTAISSLARPIQARIYESGAGLKQISMFVNGIAQPNIAVNKNTISTADNNVSTAEYVVTLDAGQLSDGFYNVVMNATDYANNNAVLSWKFKLDNSLPGAFDILRMDNKIEASLPNGSKVEDPEKFSGKNIVYVKDAPSTFTFSYEDSFADIAFDKAILSKDGVPLTKTGISCDRDINSPNKNTFSCALTDVPSDEGDYVIEIAAIKTLANGRRVQGSDKFMYIIDKTPPSLTQIDIMNITKSGMSIPIKLRSSENHGLFMIVESSDIDEPQVIMLNKALRSAKYEGALKEDIFPRAKFLTEKDVTLNYIVSDYAGNTMGFKRTLHIDNVPPVLSKIDVESKPRFKFESGEFVIRGDDLKVTGVGSSDIKKITVVRGNSPGFTINQQCTPTLATNCIESGSFNMDISSVLRASGTPQEKIRIASTFKFIITDKAGNEVELLKTVIVDRASPQVSSICIGPICFNPVQTPSTPPVTDIVVDSKKCSGVEDIDCFTALIEQSCKDIPDLPANMRSSKDICYTSRLAKLSSEITNPALSYLCNQVKGFARDNCYHIVAINTQTIAVCEQIQSNLTKGLCSQGTLPPEIAAYNNLEI